MAYHFAESNSYRAGRSQRLIEPRQTCDVWALRVHDRAHRCFGI